MNPLCQTCTNIFDFPKCCTENLEDSDKIITHCGNYSAGHTKDIPKVKLNPQTVKTLGEDWKPHYEFGGYAPECDMSGAYTITQNIIAKVADTQECACIEAIRIWAREKGYDDVLLLDESKLKEIIMLGSAEYDRLHGEIDRMSMISEQVKKLRELAKDYSKTGFGFYRTDRVLRQAADTIEALSAKLEAVNMDRSAEDCSGWIPCDKDNLPDKEVLCCDKCGEMILGYVSEDEESMTGFCAENDNVYMYNCVKWMEKPKP